ncbi:MAG: carbon starvation CstA family protein [Verrucomicrobiae bacterium]
MPRKTLPRWISIAIWSLVTAAGAGAFAAIAIGRGEPVSAIWLVVASACVFAMACRFHSAWLMAKVLTIDDLRAPPAVTNEDGKDYVPTNRWVVFGHHFAAIAGPGPLVGPVLAAQFGFLPGLLWILVGATLGGAVHDCIVMFCSIRRGGKSLGQMVREEVGPLAGFVAQISITAIMVILLAVLALVVVKALAESPWGLFTIVASMPIAMVMGLAMRAGKIPISLISFFGVAALLFSVYAGQWIPGSPVARWLTLDGRTLAFGIMGYGLLASVLPVWLLLAPRDYLSTFLKLGAVALLGVAIVALAPPLQMPALTKFIDGSGPVFAGPVFPFCFITIACAAVSGFHAIISSGTSPKLIARESDIRLVGYGAMATEMLVGIMALIAACSMPPGEYFAINMKGEPAAVTAKVTALGFPVTAAQMQGLAESVGEKNMVGRTGGAPTFAVGMASMFVGALGSKSALSLWYHFAIMFEAMFILTTIDAGTRVGRFLVQDLLGYLWRPLGRTDHVWGNWLASGGFVSAWGWFLYQGVADPLGGINSLWPIFGIANQLLAVIALALGTTVLIKMRRLPYLWVPLLPLAWLFIVTMTAGWMKIFSSDPRLGFLSAARELSSKISAGGGSAEIAQWHALRFNNLADAAVTSLFLMLVLLVLAACARVWWKLLACPGYINPLKEAPYIEHSEASLKAFPAAGIGM